MFGATGKRQQDVVGYIKTLEDGTVLYIEERRTGRKELAALSMRKYPAATNAETIAATLKSNVCNDGEGLKIVPAEGQSSVTGVRNQTYEQSAHAIPDAVARQMVDPYNETLETVDEQSTRWASDKAGDNYDRLTLKDLEDQYGDLDEVPAAAVEIAREHGAVVATMEDRNASSESHIPEEAPSLEEHRENVVREHVPGRCARRYRLHEVA